MFSFKNYKNSSSLNEVFIELEPLINFVSVHNAVEFSVHLGKFWITRIMRLKFIRIQQLVLDAGLDAGV